MTNANSDSGSMKKLGNKKYQIMNKISTHANRGHRSPCLINYIQEKANICTELRKMHIINPTKYENTFC